MKLRFHTRYFLFTVFLLLTEVGIAMYVHDGFIRPYAGDFLVVILIYCFIKTFVNTPVPAVAASVLVFSFLIEAGQYFHFVSLLGFDQYSLARVVLGTSFAWIDLVMYTAGIVCVIIVETIRKRI